MPADGTVVTSKDLLENVPGELSNDPNDKGRVI
jgi:hypothetical protein